MGMNSIWHWLIVLLVVVLLFGAGRISGVMGDLGKGLKSFKKGMAEDDEAAAATDPDKPKARITDDRAAEERAAAAAAATRAAERDKA